MRQHNQNYRLPKKAKVAGATPRYASLVPGPQVMGARPLATSTPTSRFQLPAASTSVEEAVPLMLQCIQMFMEVTGRELPESGSRGPAPATVSRLAMYLVSAGGGTSAASSNQDARLLRPMERQRDQRGSAMESPPPPLHSSTGVVRRRALAEDRVPSPSPPPLQDRLPEEESDDDGGIVELTSPPASPKGAVSERTICLSSSGQQDVQVDEKLDSSMLAVLEKIEQESRSPEGDRRSQFPMRAQVVVTTAIEVAPADDTNLNWPFAAREVATGLEVQAMSTVDINWSTQADTGAGNIGDPSAELLHLIPRVDILSATPDLESSFPAVVKVNRRSTPFTSATVKTADGKRIPAVLLRRDLQD